MLLFICRGETGENPVRARRREIQKEIAVYFLPQGNECHWFIREGR